MGTGEVTSNITGVAQASEEAGAAGTHVLTSASDLSSQAVRLGIEMTASSRPFEPPDARDAVGHPVGMKPRHAGGCAGTRSGRVTDHADHLIRSVERDGSPLVGNLSNSEQGTTGGGGGATARGRGQPG